MPRIGGNSCADFVSASRGLDCLAVQALLSLPPEIAFPGRGDRSRRRLGSNARSVWRKAEHLVLLRPFSGQVDETGNAHPVREAAIDGGFDEIGCEEGE